MEWARRLLPPYFSRERHGVAQFAGAEVKEEVVAHLLTDDYTDAVFAAGNSNLGGRSFFTGCRSEHYIAHIGSEQLANFQLCQRYRAETILGCMLRMTNEHVIVFIQVVPGIIMLYCGCPDIIWDITYDHHATRQLQARHQSLRSGHGQAVASTTAQRVKK